MENGYSKRWSTGEEMMPGELYRNTAGEIEARDAASRRSMSDWTRKMVPPDYGDENTVFAEDGKSYAIGKSTDNKPFVEVEQDILAGVPKADWVKTVKENLKKKFPNGITVGNNEIQIDGRSRQEMTFSRYMQWLYNNDPQLHADKLRATDNADEILQAATDWVNEGLKHPRKDNIKDFARGEVLLRVGGNDYTAEVVVGTRENGSMLLYDILNLQPTSFTEKETDAAITVNPSPGAGRNTAPVSDDSVPNRPQSVNKQFSVSERTPEQKKEILAQARRYASGEIGKDEFFRHVDSIDGTRRSAPSRNAYRQPPKNQSYSDEAREIYDRAHSEGVSVDEYLRRNWEEFDIDGRWSDAAQEALRMDGRRYSVEEGSYDINPTKKVGQSVKSDTSLLMTGQPENSDTSSVGDSIRSSSENVNKQFSVSERTPEQKIITYVTAYETTAAVKKRGNQKARFN